MTMLRSSSLTPGSPPRARQWLAAIAWVAALAGPQAHAQTCTPDKPYDHIVSAFHQSAVQRTDGTWAGWGATMGALGLNQVTGTPYDGRSVLRPLDIKAGGTWAAAGGNWPAGNVGLVGEPLLITMASSNTTEQTVALTTQGLFAWGFNVMLNATIKSSRLVAAFAVGGKADGLPPGVTPTDVAQLFGTYGMLAVVTKPAHGGQLWVLVNHTEADFTKLRGDGTTDAASNHTWHRVKTNGTTDLANVVAVRGHAGRKTDTMEMTLGAIMAQTADGKLYAWGSTPYFGNGVTATSASYATPVTLPQEAGADITPKMIGVTGNSSGSTMFVLSTTGTLYSVGANNQRQLAANLPETTAEATTWQVVRAFGDTEAAWRGRVKTFSVQEHDSGTIVGHGAAGALITTDDTVYTWGSNERGMIGRATTPGGTATNGFYHLGQPVTVGGARPARLVEVGGHTMVYMPKDSAQFCYVGHQIQGSMGDGVMAQADQPAFNCTDTPVVNICGATGFDNGDAPSVYENDGGSNQAMHAYTNGPLFLGTLPPQANDDTPRNVASGASNVGAHGDYIAAPLTLEEDGITQATGPTGSLTAPAMAGGDLPAILTTQTTYTLQVAYTNQTGTAATLHAWVDWNNNGIFETSEYASASAASGGSTASLGWSIPSGQAVGHRYIRLRITTKTSASDYNERFPAANVTVRSGEDARALGFAADGEIEDHRVQIVAAGSLGVVANPDSDATPVNTPVTTEVTVNDVAIGGTIGSVTAITSTSANGGTVSCTGLTCTYLPPSGYTGTDTYTYQACLAAPNATVCSTTTVTITITPTVGASPDTATTPANTPVTTPVTANDTAIGGTLDPGSVRPTGTTPPANGSVTCAAGSCTYTPNPGYTGPDAYSYQVCLAAPNGTVCEETTVAVTVTPSPGAQPDTDTTQPGTPVTTPVTGNDVPVGGTLDPGSVTPTGAPPANGTVTCAAGSCTYTPNAGFTGTDTYSYQVCLTPPDEAVCATTTVTVTVKAATPTPVPGLNAWGLALLAGLLGLFTVRRRTR
ncbi:IPTL-CTERM sorting domain-containing protein [Comamonas serinivorans]|nr:IPTL-CTERM sorting domain-containing protein [Comamonas serinivorans]